MNENDVLFKVTQLYMEKGNPSAPIRSQTKDLPITSSDALSLRSMQDVCPMNLV